MTMWFRSWHGAPTDPKWILIARKANSTPVIVSAIVWALFDHASQEENRGDVSGFDQETYAAWAGISEEEIEAVVTALTDKEIIVNGRLTAWEKRQPKREDDSRERVRAHRERVTEASNEEETQCNAPVTHGNAPEKIREDKRRTETERATDVALVPKTAKKPATRERNPHFEVIAECWIGRPYPDITLTASQSSSVGKAAAELQRVHAPPECIPAEWLRISRQYDNITPYALAKHWDATGNKPPPDIDSIRDPFMRALIRQGGQDASTTDDIHPQNGRVVDQPAKTKSLGPGVESHGTNLPAHARDARRG